MRDKTSQIFNNVIDSVCKEEKKIVTLTTGQFHSKRHFDVTTKIIREKYEYNESDTIKRIKICK